MIAAIGNLAKCDVYRMINEVVVFQGVRFFKEGKKLIVKGDFVKQIIKKVLENCRSTFLELPQHVIIAARVSKRTFV